MTVNISSPNTKNLRELQGDAALDALLGALQQRRLQLQKIHKRKVPMFLKIAPDLDAAQVGVIADTLKRHRIDGVIATNTTLERGAVQGLPHADEAGGLSGAPVLQASNRVIAQLRAALGQRYPIIGVGGVMSAADARSKIDAGADLVQIYTGLIYKGPGLVRRGRWRAGALRARHTRRQQDEADDTARPGASSTPSLDPRTTCSTTRPNAARPHLPDPAARPGPGGRLHLGPGAGPVAAHGRAPADRAASRAARASPSCRRTARTSSWPSWPSGWPATPRWRSSPPRRPRPWATCSSTARPACCSSASSTPGTRRSPASRRRCRASPSRWHPKRAQEYDGWDEIVARTAPLAGRPQRAADELAMIIYTSGSTGTPKGAMVSFGAITRAAEGIVDDLRKRARRTATTGRMLSYLPLAHSFERSWVEAASLVDGKTHVFFAESLDTFLQDLQRARPTMFITVPRLWLKFQQGVFAKMPPQKLDRLLGIPILGRIVAQEGAEGPGAGCRDARPAAARRRCRRS